MNITLIGFSGVGKTLFGTKLAKKLDYQFIDTDQLILEKTDLSLNQLLEQIGDEAFKKVGNK